MAMSFGTLLFSFQGRINRKPWWLTGLAMFVIVMILIFAIFAVIAVAGVKDALSTGPLDFVMLVLYLMLGAGNLLSHYPMALVAALGGGLLVFWIVLALAAKRLRDRNKSPWWLLVFYGLPAVMNGMGSQFDNASPIFSVAAFAISIWGLIELGILRGTVGPNQYGPDPLEGHA